ncbi:hypothetical protein [uncultured Massilia sp.]|uniref:hypothetical protein n=1 Tax=uncultured Massilia sp. TaxID=169973 RepID=UPI002584A8CB|nr:hypothetical protein [uncultured Massilia sp.]
MSMQAEGNDAKGRNYHQSTKDGTGSAASVGTGGTGDIGSMGGGAGQDGRQRESRSDDLLAGSTTHEEADEAFQGGSDGGQIQTGMEGINTRRGESGASRQSVEQQGGGNRQGADLQDPAETDATQYDQGTADRER